MNNKVLTVEELVDETIEFYNNNPRSKGTLLTALSSVSCLYNGPNDTKCAFARILKEHIYIPDKYEGKVATRVLEDLGKDIVQDKYWVTDEVEFYNRLQTLHDIEEHWVDGKITQRGLDYAYAIKKEFGRNTNN